MSKENDRSFLQKKEFRAIMIKLDLCLKVAQKRLILERGGRNGKSGKKNDCEQ